MKNQISEIRIKLYTKNSNIFIECLICKLKYFLKYIGHFHYTMKVIPVDDSSF